ncbi:MmcQ/YjbR family DNA-binding protein [uncultured Robinsoniella sp.]|uniref:MmcQ/YjbR family DNA-binding protein n=1 Tax=uncultured Robinsoniella sp. TaxID=904190 RepID=UPI00374F1525
MEETTLFRRKRVIIERLLPYGFVMSDGEYRYSKEILDGQFRLFVSILADGRVNTQIFDTSSNEEYVLHRVSGAVGSFTGSVRAAYESAMLDIAEKCFEVNIFKSKQARSVILYVREAYGDELEYLWEKFPDNAVWRCKDNGKWYGALLTVSKRKLGIQSDEIVEIIDLRATPESLDKLVDNEKYYPGWHMNKKNWYTMILDGSVQLDELNFKIDESYRLALK